MKCFLPLLPLLLLLRSLGAAELDDPETERQSFHLADGFEANLFASEADGVVKPIQIRWDPLGRLWVIGSRTYPQIVPGEEPNDQVLILEDTQHRGRADKVTVFADKLMIPTGLEVDGDGRGAWVGEGTRLWHLRDSAGTGRADQREVVLRGFGTGDNHQNLNSFLWSPAGDLLFCQGLHGFARVETRYGLVSLDEAGFWRYNVHTSRLESFFGGKADPQNPWGWVYTDGGQPLLVAGNNGGIYYPVPEMIDGHDQARVGNIWVDARARKTSGPDLVGTTHLPPEWQGVFLTGGYINNAVWALKVQEDGAGFRVTDLPPLLTSTHPSFRPVDVKIGPDGAIYLCDWYNPIIGHYQASFRHPNRDKVHGRIWRITYQGRPLVTAPQIVGADAKQLAANLASPERWTRQQTRRYLSTLGGPVALPAELLEGPASSEQSLLEWAAVAATRDEPSLPLVQKLLAAEMPDARAAAADLAVRWQNALPDSVGLLRSLVADEHPRVRLAAVVAAANLRRPESLELALSATSKPLDPFLESALHQAIVGLKPIWLPALRAGALSLNAAEMDYLLRHEGTPDTVEPLRKVLASGDLAPERRLALLEALAQVGGPDDLTLLLPDRLPDTASQVRGLQALATAYRARKVKAAGTLPPLDALPLPVRAEALRLAGLYHAPCALANLRAAVQVEALRPAAIGALATLGGPEAIALLRELSRPPSPVEVQVQAVAGLTLVALPEAAGRAAALLASAESAATPEALLAPFLERKEGATELAKALTTASLPPARREAILNYLRTRGRMDESLVAALQSGAPASLRATPEYVAQMVKDVHDVGDPQHGDELFHSPRLVCMGCHAVGGAGGTIGPSLDAIGTGQPLDFIIGAVLEPQKEVKEGYEAVEVTTKDGQMRQGYRVRETADELVLRDLGANQEVRLPRTQVTQRREIGSLMPTGLVDGLTHEEQRDLFRYLSELGRPK